VPVAGVDASALGGICSAESRKVRKAWALLGCAHQQVTCLKKVAFVDFHIFLLQNEIEVCSLSTEWLEGRGVRFLADKC
jgi:hypothetical protein